MLPGEGEQPPKGPRRGDVAILLAGSWPVWVRVPSREAAGGQHPPWPTSGAPPPGCLLSEQTEVARRKSPSQGRSAVLTTEGRSHHPAHR